MKKINKISIVVLILMGLVACNDPSQPPVDDHAQITPSAKATVEQINHSEQVSQKETSMDAEEFCETLNVETWFGFDDASTEPMCHTVKFYQLKPYQCDISKHAFGLDEEAIYIEKGKHRIFAYSAEEQCIEVLDVRNSNAP